MAPRTFANLDATLGDWMALRTLPNLDATEELAWKLQYINIEMRMATDLETLMHPDFRNLPQHIQCRLKEMLQKALTSLTARLSSHLIRRCQLRSHLIRHSKPSDRLLG